jgi:hypothetical protein
MLFHHLRVPTTSEKRGIFSALNMQMFDHYAEAYGPWWEGGWYPYGYVALANVAAMRLGAPGSWSIGPLRLLLDCASVAGDAYGAVARKKDAEQIVEIINACHADEAMFLSYTVEYLTERLERAPELYSWGNLLLGERAVLGVWPSGLRVTTERDGERRESVRASTLDHGFLPEAEASFERLLRSYCARLLEQGHNELSLILSETSPGYAIVRDLAFETEPFDFKMAIPEPEGAAAKGLYVDAIYF